jgi:hypothetical protein
MAIVGTKLNIEVVVVEGGMRNAASPENQR